MVKKPSWWAWELEFTPHLLKRMIDRGFTEVDVRRMIEDANAVLPTPEPGRWIVETNLERRKWFVVVEPDEVARTLVVITAYHPEAP